MQPTDNEQADTQQEQNASPQEQAQYDFLIHNGTAVMSAPGQLKKSFEIITSVGDYATGTGFLVGSILFDLSDDAIQAAGAAGGQGEPTDPAGTDDAADGSELSGQPNADDAGDGLSDDALLEAAKDMIEDMRSYLEKAKLCNVNDSEEKVDAWFSSALHTALIVAHGDRAATGKTDPRLLQKRMATLLQNNGIDPAALAAQAGGQQSNQQAPMQPQGGGVLVGMSAQQ